MSLCLSFSLSLSAYRRESLFCFAYFIDFMCFDFHYFPPIAEKEQEKVFVFNESVDFDFFLFTFGRLKELVKYMFREIANDFKV